MQMTNFPFSTTDWSKIKPTKHEGERGCAYWRTQHFGRIRVRLIECVPGYLADHWCSKGHIIFCMEGEFQTEFQDGRELTITSGMSYQVPDNSEPHRSHTDSGAKLFVVD